MPWHPCVNSRDTITQEEGVVLQNFDSLGDDQHTVSSHCRDANGTWITWFDNTSETLGARYNDIGTFTGNTFPVHVGYFPDDGSAATVYDLAVGYIWNWKALGRYSNVSPCFVRFPSSSLYFGNNVQCELVGWNTGVLDVQVRTDGSNVWVVALAQESVMYPALSHTPRLDRCGIEHPSIFTDAQGEGLTTSSGLANPATDGSAHDHDTTGAGAVPGGGTWWQQSGVPGVDDPDDAGENSSFRWQPARVTVWGGDLGGFTMLGADDAEFLNYSGSAAKGIGLCSGLEVAASPAEPGVCHVLWSEAGGEGYYYDSLGQRISYSRWAPDAPISQTDIGRRDESNPAYLGDPSSGFLGTGEWAWTAEMILRNDHGSPCAIILPWFITSSDDTSISGGVSAPTYYDLSGGSAVSVQVMDVSLYPTAAEAGFVGAPAASAGLLSGGGNPLTVSNFHRRHFASSLYTDPTYVTVGPGGVGTQDSRDVYLLCVGFYDTAGVPGGGITTGTPAVAFYRIPCDGSIGFDYMDGTRLPMYSLLPIDASPEESLTQGDFVSDPGNVWIPCAPANEVGGGVLHLPRTCTRTWEILDAFPSTPTSRPARSANEGTWVTAGSVVDAPTSPPSIITDDAGNDWLAGGGVVTDLTFDAQAPITVAALQAKICRCCVPCIERIGLHIWEKV